MVLEQTIKINLKKKAHKQYKIRLSENDRIKNEVGNAVSNSQKQCKQL